jgi:hypothetical protein
VEAEGLTTFWQCSSVDFGHQLNKTSVQHLYNSNGDGIRFDFFLKKVQECG